MRRAALSSYVDVQAVGPILLSPPVPVMVHNRLITSAAFPRGGPQCSGVERSLTTHDCLYHLHERTRDALITVGVLFKKNRERGVPARLF